MVTSAARRLPGIGFEAPAVRAGVALPRMDVAAFVGFAPTGPLQLPVPIDDVRSTADYRLRVAVNLLVDFLVTARS